MMAAKKHPKTCAYCGRLSHEWTEDHAIPECLWDDRPIPEFAVKVPACLNCNNFWSADEGYFRSMMALLAQKGGHPLVKQMLLGGTVQRHFDKDNKFRRGLVDTLRIVPQFTHTGLYVGHGPAVDMDWKRWLRVSGKIVRGLYFKHRQKPVPPSHVVHVWQGEDFWRDIGARSIVDQLPVEFGGFGRMEDGFDDIFMGKRAPISDNADGMVYLFVFYKAVSMFAYVMPATFAKYTDPSHPDQVALEIAARRLKKKQHQKN